MMADGARVGLGALNSLSQNPTNSSCGPCRFLRVYFDMEVQPYRHGHARVASGCSRVVRGGVTSARALADRTWRRSSPPTARADFKEWSVAAWPAYAVTYVDSRAPSGGGGGLEVGFGITESLTLRRPASSAGIRSTPRRRPPPAPSASSPRWSASTTRSTSSASCPRSTSASACSGCAATPASATRPRQRRGPIVERVRRRRRAQPRLSIDAPLVASASSSAITRSSPTSRASRSTCSSARA